MGWEKKFTEMNMDTYIAWLVEVGFNEIIINTVLLCGSWSLKVLHTVYLASFEAMIQRHWFFFLQMCVPQECSYLQLIMELESCILTLQFSTAQKSAWLHVEYVLYITF